MNGKELLLEPDHSKLFLHNSLQSKCQEDQTRYSSQDHDIHHIAARTTTFKAVRCYRKFNQNRQPTGLQDHKFSENITKGEAGTRDSCLERMQCNVLYVHTDSAKDLWE
ncbi:hypothetical protein Enr17x_48030 [Gimesia fumaroli]|uniref:Uncharacterized protein n=1 Tax=Gimesia fumaroli TaxID=2527976 RepID=A0A518II19_9PLAN|nr:hypothetical protein Enr17x_48030 [Gimesia fumaroli]